MLSLITDECFPGKKVKDSKRFENSQTTRGLHEDGTIPLSEVLKLLQLTPPKHKRHRQTRSLSKISITVDNSPRISQVPQDSENHKAGRKHIRAHSTSLSRLSQHQAGSRSSSSRSLLEKSTDAILNVFTKNPSEDSFPFEGARVDISWPGKRGRRTSVKGFVLKRNMEEPSMFHVIRDFDFKEERFPKQFIRPRQMDFEGFLVACKLGIVKAVMEWVQAGHDMNTMLNGVSAIHMACSTGQIEVMRLLIDVAGAKTEIQPQPFGQNPLDMAFLSGHRPAICYVRQLIAKKYTRRKSIVGFGSEVKHEILQRFIEVFSFMVPEIGAGNVQLIRVPDFVGSCTKFLRYDECVALGLHVAADTVEKHANILFISHRWESTYEPDLQRLHYNTTLRFLEKQDQKGEPIQYIWLDYSCICQDRMSTECPPQLRNISTALLLSTHCLVLPQLERIQVEDADNNEEVGKYYLTDIRDFLSRAWCRQELICCMLAGVKIQAWYYLEKHVDEFVEVPGRSITEGADPKSQTQCGFNTVACQVLQRALDQEGNRAETQELFDAIMDEWWEIDGRTSPTGYLEKLVNCMSGLLEDEGLMMKIGTLNLTLENLEAVSSTPPRHQAGGLTPEQAGKPMLLTLLKELGHCSVDMDRILIMRSLLLLLIYCMDKVPGFLLSIPEFLVGEDQAVDRNTGRKIYLPPKEISDTDFIAEQMQMKVDECIQELDNLTTEVLSESISTETEPHVYYGLKDQKHNSSAETVNCQKQSRESSMVSSPYTGKESEILYKSGCCHTCKHM